jgi:hypothetical protein
MFEVRHELTSVRHRRIAYSSVEALQVRKKHRYLLLHRAEHQRLAARTIS